MISVVAVGGILIILCFITTIILIIASDRTRYLTRFDLTHWDEKLYLSQLPNFLQYLHEYGYTSPWPSRMNAIAARYFRHQVRGILQDRPNLERRNFLHMHLNLQVLLFVLKPFIDEAILLEQAVTAARQVARMRDSADRDRLQRFVNTVRYHHDEFMTSLSAHERTIIAEMTQRDFMGSLRTANAIFHEHGFDNLLPGLDTLRRWQSLGGSDIVQELPTLPQVSPQDLIRRTASLSTGQAPHSDA